MADIKYLSIDEFRSKGYLHEANRRFFHPLGLALEVRTGDPGELQEALRKVVDDADSEGELGTILLRHIVEALVQWMTNVHIVDGWVSGVWDYRDDPEGMIFTELDSAFMRNIREQWVQREPQRRAMLGFMVQDRDVSNAEYERLNSGENRA